MKDLIQEGRKIQEAFKKNVGENINEATPTGEDMKIIKQIADIAWNKWKTKMPSDFHNTYGNLPRSISNKLTGDFVDAMDAEVQKLSINKNYFTKVFANQKSVEDMVLRAYKKYGSII